MSDKIVVRFLKAWRGYSADELAGFDPEVVEGLKAKGFAEVYEGGGTASRPKAAKPSTSKPRAAKPSGKADEGADGAGNGEGNEDNVGGEGEDLENLEATDEDEKP